MHKGSLRSHSCGMYLVICYIGVGLCFNHAQVSALWHVCDWARHTWLFFLKPIDLHCIRLFSASGFSWMCILPATSQSLQVLQSQYQQPLFWPLLLRFHHDVIPSLWRLGFPKGQIQCCIHGLTTSWSLHLCCAGHDPWCMHVANQPKQST